MALKRNFCSSGYHGSVEALFELITSFCSILDSYSGMI